MGIQLQTRALAEEQEKRIARPERLFHEINLLHLEGYYFTFDPKAANIFLDPMKSVEKRPAESGNQRKAAHRGYPAPRLRQAVRVCL